MKEPNVLTMKDIAKMLKVSVATVSRALKDSPNISREQREKIQKFAREHNYYPNVIAEQLRHTRSAPTKVIGVIVPEFIHYYFSSILSGIEREAYKQGYRILVAQSNEQYTREVEICESFFQNKVCGIIVSQAKDTKNTTTSSECSTMACLLCSTTESAPASTAIGWWSTTTWAPSMP